MLLGMLVIIAGGGIGTYMSRVLFGSLNYTVETFSQVFVHEFIFAVKIYLIGLVPFLWAGMIIIFRKTSFIKLQIIAVLIGIIAGMPTFISSMSDWFLAQ